MTAPQKYTNRLVDQKSPYLLQHAHNPVDWHPWGPEAFAIAKTQDKPIFLSIGYSTCHWCHVMERESFEDVEIAKQLNDTCICVKVDREELPEVDALYMEFAQGMMAGAVGWPLNVVLTPNLTPFFAATYLAPHGRHGLMGLTELIERIREVWHGEEREAVIEQADKVVEVFSANIHTNGEELPQKEDLDEAADVLFKMADPVHGGMRGTPKFPLSYQYNFVLRYAARSGDSRALFLVERTLDMMHRGGIDDHLGGGFSRYSVDERWMVPHFEKMLYDNALLANTFLEAWQATQKDVYRQGTTEILDYLLRTMRNPEGAFYSAEDAESEGKEGYYYTWTPREIVGILGPEQGALFCDYYDVTEMGNFEGRSILHEATSMKDFAERHGVEPKKMEEQFAAMRKKLFLEREKRTHPNKDDKVLSGWNGLAIYSLAEAGACLDQPTYLDAAVRAASFIRSKMWKEGKLLRRWRDGDARFAAGLDEYAYIIRSLISLFEVGMGCEWLHWAMLLTEHLKENYKAPQGAFYQTDGSDESLLLRKVQFADGAEPSGNAVHCENLMRLYQISLNSDYLEQACDVLKAVKPLIDQYAPGYCYSLMNIDRFYDRQAPTLIIALGDEDFDHLEPIRHLIYKQFVPHKAVIWRHDDDERLYQLVPYVRDQKAIDGKTTLYICRQGICQKPIVDMPLMIEAIQNLNRA